MAFSDDVDSSHIAIEGSGLGHVDSLHVEIENKCVFFHKIYKYWDCLHSSNFEPSTEFRVHKIATSRQFSLCSRKMLLSSAPSLEKSFLELGLVGGASSRGAGALEEEPFFWALSSYIWPCSFVL